MTDKAILAINGGDKAIRGPLPRYNSIDRLERHNLDNAMFAALSGYIGGVDRGGYWCEKLEEQFRERFNVKHAIAINSATSGLLAACVAAEVGPGTVVATSPYTMSGTIAPAQFLGARVGFCDIERQYFQIDTGEDFEGVDILIVPNIFGHPAELDRLRFHCDRFGVVMIEDNAQSPFAMEYGKYAGTVGHMGVFSFNVHKHIQCGEGGVFVTDDDEYAAKVRGVRNHGELSGGGPGLNLRMTELAAAVASAQMERAEELIAGRVALAERLTEIVQPYNFMMMPPKVRPGCKHVYYTWATKVYGGARDWVCSALRAEGMPINSGYSKLYDLPAFKVDPAGLPVCERVDSQMAMVEVCSIDPDDSQMKQIAEAFEKVLGEAVKKEGKGEFDERSPLSVRA